MMKSWPSLIARIVSAVCCVTLGCAIQIGFWKTPDRSYLDALCHHPYLWIVYVLLSLLVG